MAKQPCVLHISSLALSRGGIETFLVNLTRGLSSCYDMVIASSGNRPFQNRIFEAGGRTVAWDVKSNLDMKAIRGLWELIERECPSLVHIHDARAGLLGRLVLATKDIPVIVTTHLPSYYYRRDRFPRIWRGIYIFIETILNRFFTTKVIYPSQSGYQYALKWGIVPLQKAVCIPNGIETSLLSKRKKNRNAFRSQMGIKPDQPVICTLGRLSVEKNVSLVIDAFSQIRTRHSNACLWITGDGPERINLETQVHANGLSGQVFFLSGELNVALPLAACNIFVLASWYEGGRTLSVMEAQIFGKPCVVSAVGDLPEMVEDGVYGFVFPEGDIDACANALERLLADPLLCEEMGQAARKKALMEYTVEKMLSAYDALYQAVLAVEKLS